MRNPSYDILKGIGFLLVLWGHTFCPPALKTTIYSFHMPLFFFVSGCFFKDMSLKGQLKNKSRRLLRPWVFFVIFCLALYIAFDVRLGKGLNEIYSHYSAEVLTGLIGDRDSKLFYQSIWFLICLFEVSIIYAALKCIFKRDREVTYTCLTCYVGGYLLNVFHATLPYLLDTTLSMLIFYHIGYCFRFYKLDQKNVKILHTILLLTFLIAIVYFAKPRIDVKENIFPIYLLPLSLLIIVSLFYFIQSIVRKIGTKHSIILDTLTILGIESLIILGLHRPIYYTLPSVYTRFSIPETIMGFNSDYAIGVFMIVATTAICIIISKHIHKYLPSIFGHKL